MEAELRQVETEKLGRGGHMEAELRQVKTEKLGGGEHMEAVLWQVENEKFGEWGSSLMAFICFLCPFFIN